MDRVAKSSGNANIEEFAQQTLNDATNAYKVTRQIAQNFRIDREGNVHGLVQKLMEEPIKYAEAVLGALGPAQLNAEGRTFCGQFLELTRKYPFNTGSKLDASLEEINAIFRPNEGKLYVFLRDGPEEPSRKVEAASRSVSRTARVRITDQFPPVLQPRDSIQRSAVCAAARTTRG